MMLFGRIKTTCSCVLISQCWLNGLVNFSLSCADQMLADAMVAEQSQDCCLYAWPQTSKPLTEAKTWMPATTSLTYPAKHRFTTVLVCSSTECQTELSMFLDGCSLMYGSNQHHNPLAQLAPNLQGYMQQLVNVRPSA